MLHKRVATGNHSNYASKRALKQQTFAEGEIAIQQQMMEAKKNKRANALKELKCLCKEYGFAAGRLKG